MVAPAAFVFEWGEDGLRSLAPGATVVIVDVLRFSTAVSAAVESGATVMPAPWSERSAEPPPPGVIEVSLSPTALLSTPPGERLLLRSPNGARLAAIAPAVGARHVLAGCLRNARATARRAAALAGANGTIAVVAAGERWGPSSGPLRPAVEDLIGAGAVLAALDPSAATGPPRCSAEAAAARAAFVAARPLLHDALVDSVSGRELIGRGLDEDVLAASALDVTDLAAVLGSEGFARG